MSRVEKNARQLGRYGYQRWNNEWRDIVDKNGKSVVSYDSKADKIVISDKASSSTRRVISAMLKTQKGKEIVKGLVESKTKVGIVVSKKAKFRNDANGDKKLLFAENDPGSVSEPGEPFVRAIIRIYEGSLAKDQSNEGSNFEGLITDEFLNLVAVHEGTHVLVDPAVYKEFYDNCKKCNDAELEEFVRSGAFEKEPEANEETSRSQLPVEEPNKDEDKDEEEKEDN